METEPATKAPGKLNLPRLYPRQYWALFNDDRYSLIEASTKAGKTIGALIWLLGKAWETGQEGRNYWWVAPVLPQAKIAFRRLKALLRKASDKSREEYIADASPDDLADDELGAPNETECWIKLINGAVIWFKGSDRPDTLYGEDVYAAVIDEASRAREDSWYAVRSTVTYTLGPIRMIGNVRGRRNWFYRLARKAEAGNLPNASYHKITAADAVEAGIMDPEEVKDAERVLPPQVFRELFFAEATDDGSNPFGLEAIRRCIMGLAPGPSVCRGIDLAKRRDWLVIVELNAKGRVCYFDRWQADWGQSERRMLDRMRTARCPTSIDATGVGDPIVEALQRKCSDVEGYVFTSKSKQQLMENLAAKIQSADAGFPDGVMVSELESFEFNYSRAGVTYSAPDGMFDDTVCALALAHLKRPLYVVPPPVHAGQQDQHGRMAYAWESDELTKDLP